VGLGVAATFSSESSCTMLSYIGEGWYQLSIVWSPMLGMRLYLSHKDFTISKVMSSVSNTQLGCFFI